MGLLLREVAEGLQAGPEVRHLAVAVLKNLLIKHAMDDRYALYKVREGGGERRRGREGEFLRGKVCGGQRTRAGREQEINV